jgi:hypothetical protein
MRLRNRIWVAAAGVVLAVSALLTTAAYKAFRLKHIGEDVRTQVRYLVDNDENIGTQAASTTFSADYLGAIFGDDPELLAQLKQVVDQGIKESPLLNLGEVSSMIVTYRKDKDGNVTDVAAHILGGFPLTRRKPGFHRDGYFRNLLSYDLWTAGNRAVNLLGRDMIIFANEEVIQQQQQMLEEIFNGNIMPLVETLDKPLYFTAVFPDPRNVVPGQLKRHIQAIVWKGELSMYEGRMEAIILCSSPKAARFTLSIINDLKLAAVVALKTKWKGVIRQTPWGPMVDPWWAYETVQTLEKTELEKEESILRVSSDFKRVMVNVVLKSIERMGRDIAQMRGSLDDKKDPRLVDADLKTSKPLHYWSEAHRWGPNWPIPPADWETNAPAHMAAVTDEQAPDETAPAAAEPTENN